MRVSLDTTAGNITLELDSQNAPITVANFVQYVEKGHYDGVIFHRVIPGFMIQGGGFTPDMQQLETAEPIQNESDNGLSNLRGTIAMARTRDPHSATAQFFINTVDNRRLDGTPGRPGYTVFGKVSSGMEVVDLISKAPTGSRGHYRDVPVTPIIINKAIIVESE
ncbi:peptidyl-prolyl cis-trans isomerase [Marinobacterium sediminicola]|nr:peptidylprolyl isomerase [Marinobacterium sediminicola]ULG70806.1 peptidyl-prolyl cis-trans isomerase [Marinobacterium sediminicola]